jgi:hypothetical protein
MDEGMKISMVGMDQVTTIMATTIIQMTKTKTLGKKDLKEDLKDKMIYLCLRRYSYLE